MHSCESSSAHTSFQDDSRDPSHVPPPFRSLKQISGARMVAWDILLSEAIARCFLPVVSSAICLLGRSVSRGPSETER